jgi:nucleoside-diphosphate-sugar epimerase
VSEPDFTIFGAGGFVGGHLARRLGERGAAVRAATRDDWPAPGERLGHAIYAVGLTADFRTRPFETVEAHVGLLARTLAAGGFASFLYLSSTRTYRGAASTTEDAELVMTPTNPDRLYDLSKLCGEALCLSRPDPGVRVARLSNVFGAGDDPANFLRAVVSEAQASGAVTLRQALASAKDYVAVEDVCDALAAIAEAGGQRLYNVASGINTRHGEIAEVLQAVLGARVEVSDGAPVVADAPIDVGRLRAEVDWAPRSVLDYLRQTLSQR